MENSSYSNGQDSNMMGQKSNDDSRFHSGNMEDSFVVVSKPIDQNESQQTYTDSREPSEAIRTPKWTGKETRNKKAVKKRTKVEIEMKLPDTIEQLKSMVSAATTAGEIEVF